MSKRDHESAENTLEDVIRNGSSMSQKEITQIQFAEYLKKMGMREYDNKDIFFYPDELDVQQKKVEKKILDQTNLSNTDNSTSIMKEEDINYDVDLLNSLFSDDPEKQIRISRNKANNS